MKRSGLSITARFQILAICCGIFSAPSAFAGGEHSGGGAFREAQFKAIGYAIIDLLKGAKNAPVELSRIYLRSLKNAVDTVRVEATEETLHPSGRNGKPDLGRTTDAINIPAKNLIRFNIYGWDFIPSGSQRAALVLHEYLGILDARGEPNCDDHDYRISRQLRERESIKNYFDSLDIAQMVMDQVKLDFPVKCSYQLNGGKTFELDPIGENTLGSGVEVAGPFVSINACQNDATQVFQDPKTKKYLGIVVYDEAFNGDGMMWLVRAPGPYKNALRVIIGMRDTTLKIPEQLFISQSVAISQNLKFEFDLAKPKLHFECHRMRRSAPKRPVDLDD